MSTEPAIRFQDADPTLTQYSYEWETDNMDDPYVLNQQLLNEQVQSTERGWHRVHHPGIHKADGGPFYGDYE